MTFVSQFLAANRLHERLRDSKSLAMAEIFNLKRARKAKTRADAEAKAQQNRVAHGRSKAERRAADAEAARDVARHEGHRRERDT